MGKSRLVLGTVQLGVEYGVGNVHGMPAKKEALAILDTAFEGGINVFDTASTYGEAESILGEWMEVRGIKDDIYIITKVKAATPEGVRAAFKRSLGRMGTERVDGCLLHDPKQLYEDEVFASLREMKDANLFSHFGVSVYDEGDALHAVGLGIGYIQVPYNAFDQRLDRTDFFSRAKENKVTVFARSPFLQGLLLMHPEHLPPHLAHARVYLEQFADIAKQNGISQLEAALGFSLLHSRADHLVFGVDTVTQLKDIISIVDNMSEDCPWVQEIVSNFSEVDRSIVDPSTWDKNI